jgi:SAM-dependent methyltransferase
MIGDDAAADRPPLTTRPAPPLWTPSAHDSADAVKYGPDIATEGDLRLLGHLEAKRVLELGCGAGPNAVALAQKGARVIAVDPNLDDLSAARRRSERAGVRVEFHHGDLADLAFVRADTVDGVLSAYSLALVADLNRVFRQVHRVLKPDAPLVFSLPHPAFSMLAGDTDEPLAIQRSYFERSPLRAADDRGVGAIHHHTIGDLFMSLVRANFRVDALLEPEPLPSAPRSEHWSEAFRQIPRTLILRARKEGL